ncbi:hypothetical protein T484DRAFT_1832715, partial [Baffinella frigidus]
VARYPPGLDYAENITLSLQRFSIRFNEDSEFAACEVVPGGAAERAGMHEGDVLDGVHGKDFEGKTLVQALAILSKAPVRFKVEVKP